MVASSCRISNRREEGNNPAKEEGVEARASVGKASRRSSTSYSGCSSGAMSAAERVVDAYVETESRESPPFGLSASGASTRFVRVVVLSLITVGAVLFDRSELSVSVELELPPLPARPGQDLQEGIVESGGVKISKVVNEEDEIVEVQV